MSPVILEVGFKTVVNSGVKITTSMKKRVLMLAKTFPAYHVRKGEPTEFVDSYFRHLQEIYLKDTLGGVGVHIHQKVKKHTMRTGHRWRTGDIADVREWSGAPYRTKQVKLFEAKIERVYSVEIYRNEDRQELHVVIGGKQYGEEILPLLAANDGLSLDDFMSWFRYFKQPFDGQIICFTKRSLYK